MLLSLMHGLEGMIKDRVFSRTAERSPLGWAETYGRPTGETGAGEGPRFSTNLPPALDTWRQTNQKSLCRAVPTKKLGCTVAGLLGPRLIIRLISGACKDREKSFKEPGGIQQMFSPVRKNSLKGMKQIQSPFSKRESRAEG
ncbi:unnamed protein product [Boreogadus saida]